MSTSNDNDLDKLVNEIPSQVQTAKVQFANMQRQAGTLGGGGDFAAISDAIAQIEQAVAGLRR